jgi:hypothetical protein
MPINAQGKPTTFAVSFIQKRMDGSVCTTWKWLARRPFPASMRVAKDAATCIKETMAMSF